MTNIMEKVQSAAIVEAEQAEVAETATPNSAKNLIMQEEKLNNQIEVKDSEEVTVATAAAEENTNEVETISTETTDNDDAQPSVDSNAEATAPAEFNVSISESDSEQVELSPELLATVRGFLKNGIRTKLRLLFSYQDAVKSGLKPAFVKGNRNVYSSQIDKLWKEIASKPVKKFSRSCVVLGAAAILKRNESLPEEKKVKLYDLLGNELTLATPDIDKYYVVSDGQHRLAVCTEHPEADMDMELVDYDGDIMDLIKILNSTDRNWKTSDYNKSNIDTGKVDGALMKMGAVIKGTITCSEKVALYLATFKRDALTKVGCINGKDESGYTPAKGERGLNIAKAIRYKFGDEKIKIEFVDAIVKAYDAIEAGVSIPLASLMVGYIAEMSDGLKEAILSKINEAEYGTVNETVKKGFKEYENKQKGDITERIKEIQAKIDAVVKTPDLDSLHDDLKEGFPGDVLRQRNENSITEISKKVVDLEEKESKLVDAINKLKGKENPSDAEQLKLQKAENTLNDVRKSLESANLTLNDLKKKREFFNKVA